ncbi:hypothetical protein ACIHFE_34215 [Streptomyces sp. NPDC052396]|uniref:hypothetical protein n=1 Tax=Streptomyces sp. NPDC052396 TaxID=3365689 RepID=UPI0037D92E26
MTLRVVEGVVLQEVLDELVAVVLFDIGQQGGGEGLADGAPVGSVGGRVGGGQQAVEPREFTGVWAFMSVVAGFEPCADRCFPVLGGLGTGEVLGNDQAADEFLLDRLARHASCGDLAQVFLLVRDEDVDGPVVQ